MGTASVPAWAEPAPTGPGADAALFDDADAAPLDAELALPLSELLGKKSRKPSFEATLTLAGTTYPVTVTPRGKSRLEACRFPPLWLDFPKGKLKGGILAGQNKLKLVTHCSNSLAPRGYLASEMLAYRLLNLFTERSFRVRALRMTYNDTDKNRALEQPAFLIEHKNALGERLGLKDVDVEKIHTSRLDPAHAGLMNLYQYMIANTDFSMIRGPQGDTCCHNMVTMIDDAGVYFPVAYDFDSSGIVNPPYSSPNRELGVSRFTQRKYRGFCEQNEDLQRARAQAIELREEVFALIAGFDDIPGLKHARMAKFIEGFYKVIGDDSQFNKHLLNKCRQT